MIHMKVFRSFHRQKALFSIRRFSDDQNPFRKTWSVISKEIPVLFGLNKKPTIYPEHADVVVIGGGFIGSAVAYWLKQRTGEGLSVVVFEKDPSYNNIQSNVSLGTITQHYSLPENMYLAQYGAEFLRNAKQNLGNNVDIKYCPHGHLVLASEKYAGQLEENVNIQKEYGVKSQLLTVADIKKRYPWINTQDVKLGCISTESEGTFDAWVFLQGLINKSQELGANYVKAEVIGFELEQQRDVLMEGIAPGSFKKINRVIYRSPDNEEHAVKFAACILAAGPESGEIAKFAKIGTGGGLLKIPLPIKARENKVYSFENCVKTAGLNTPLLTDTSGLWLRRNGLDSNLLCGHVPLLTSDVKDHMGEEFLNKIILPSLINRIPDCKDVKVKEFTKEVFDYNTYDDSGILGPHPYHNNLFIATGFGKQGCSHAPGLGRAIAELIIDSHFNSIDLTRLTFDRLLTDQPMIEFNIY
ncbi:FAD-dependent oxidoreductase domain-containing protein 1-like [Pectinophora gossypiella]|uniref:FAD-dependent oxidoreductase domain-containing protein 1-like n=1 Tax=Pectinophora gossypiella TaxID=13191 RepID=UPI00214E0427|nr:FAD-dependent oxidoreductase domain-containing protein 1-like [Pectinophora gossypiella]